MGKLPKCILALLRSSWREIGYEYRYLTPEEKTCISEAEFNEACDAIRAAERTGVLPT